MAFLWENLAKQLDSIRASEPFNYGALATPSNPPSEGSREERLKAALKAVKATGNKQMIESLTAALEGREAKIDIPSIESGPQAFLNALNQKEAT